MAKKTENEVKDAKKETAVMDEAAREKFQQKLKELLALAKKKKNMLEYQEISDFFAEFSLEEEQFDKILEMLEQSNIDVLRIKKLCHGALVFLFFKSTDNRCRRKRSLL